MMIIMQFTAKNFKAASIFIPHLFYDVPPTFQAGIFHLHSFYSVLEIPPHFYTIPSIITGFLTQIRWLNKSL